MRAVINLVISECGLAIVNPFSNVYFHRSVRVQKRLPVNVDDIKKVQKECYKVDDEKRWLIALIADMGIRLGEGMARIHEGHLEEAQVVRVEVVVQQHVVNVPEVHIAGQGTVVSEAESEPILKVNQLVKQWRRVLIRL